MARNHDSNPFLFPSTSSYSSPSSSSSSSSSKSSSWSLKPLSSSSSFPCSSSPSINSPFRPTSDLPTAPSQPSSVFPSPASAAAVLGLCAVCRTFHAYTENCCLQGSESQLAPESVGSLGEVPSLVSINTGTPKRHFSMLFDAIANKVASKQMEDVLTNFEQYKARKISREGFIKKLRMVVGDALLKSTIKSLLVLETV
ncbi:cell wall integrity and stress response component 1 [Ricinus communis]|uniref:RST domain-containing protein n=1 Tax=Ricinus communis TaxID=3988 RepID=B9SUN2_RICCO|nr:cell wall integrity and stress response component 1 [Ricinus communis]EEF32667.1 conserved hypothetical protein [Ricinus communis]|eukprot:XP_002529701.1 cell wall integrity and stress response component 1 [Ricinus communis]